MPLHYKTFGLSIRSECELPLPPSEPANYDVSIDIGTVPEHLETPLHTGMRFEVNADEIILRVDEIANFWIRNGDRITIQPNNSQVPASDLAIYLLGSGLAAILEQRGLCCLHASAVARNGLCYLFIGQSGSGKSTLSAALAQRGFEPFTDDVCPLSIQSGKLFATPGYPASKLWPDSLHALSQDPNKLEQIRSNISKRRLCWPTVSVSEKLPIGKIFQLAPSPKSKAELRTLSPIEALAVCKNLRYRPQLQTIPSTHERHFETLALIAKSIPVIQVERPKNTFQLKELVDLIISKIDA